MRKLVLFVVMVALMIVSVNANSAEVRRPGMHFRGLFPPKVLFDPKADYTGGVSAAVADLIRGGTAPNLGNYRNALIQNNQGFDITVKVTIDYINGVYVPELLAGTGVRIIPGYEPVDIPVPRHSSVLLPLQPGDYAVQVFKANRPAGHNLIFNGYLHVDVVRGASIKQAYDAVFRY